MIRTYTHRVRNVFMSLGGDEDQRPHVIKCLLHRRKIDVNREIEEATFGGGFGLSAKPLHFEYHNFIDKALDKITQQGSRVLYVDIHGQVSS